MNVYIIAEAGASHGGDVSRAIDLVYSAKMAGADCCKFQIWKTEKFIAPTSSFFRPFKNLELPIVDWEYIKLHCDLAEIDFLASAFDKDSVDFLCDMGVSKIKVASSDIVFEPLIRHVGKRAKSIILSTGMATEEEISRAINWIGNVPTTLLKCTVDYPCENENVNLVGMATLMKQFGRPVGLSDHTKGHLAGVMAVAMGASVIEKHFALEETEEAIGNGRFREYVKQIREAEKVLGSPYLGTFACEEKWKPIARRGESGLRE